MFDNIKSADELYATENEKEYYDRKLLEYQDMYSIKQAITSYSKIKLFNIDQQQKLKYECYSKCYDNNQVIFENSEEGIKKLSKCLTECKKQTKDLKQFLKNVDKLVYFKNQTCHSNCDQMINYNVDQTYQEKISNKVNIYRCRWVCENKLDRRYREFWLQQRNDIIDRYSSQMAN
ncbi:unnamed protein product (macronuclear) [Paramecium tetraurelia]|uniref:Chromosome undetermined scaffold_1, whole genome shotgun sequence n=1 Tax=Paramecium tetraurelia TaxID=5888 RepID=Q6BGG3_PARTE|nr:hypothetical protein [Paramecium tetraurelia strain d4-2]XP_001423451.1 uncharacterized protein GSPATT00000488001 [Paramecium tetraurelia]CAH03257.1 hypothetical protein PTMB.60c [Paramecium tetraurelia]CAK56053.1 unnamed protein product [Paramecium tetraurelia]|eukprot:XP_001423451.1 hypothetical protein (macronuclear) [Paramecium tetraurelia strain d4-2]